MGWLYLPGIALISLKTDGALGAVLRFRGLLRGDLDVNEPWTCTGHGIVNLIEVLAEFNAILIKD